MLEKPYIKTYVSYFTDPKVTYTAKNLHDGLINYQVYATIDSVICNMEHLIHVLRGYWNT